MFLRYLEYLDQIVLTDDLSLADMIYVSLAWRI